jgi:hypothetical protein
MPKEIALNVMPAVLTHDFGENAPCIRKPPGLVRHGYFFLLSLKKTRLEDLPCFHTMYGQGRYIRNCMIPTR